jgi:hypothetical protein
MGLKIPVGVTMKIDEGSRKVIVTLVLIVGATLLAALKVIDGSTWLAIAGGSGAMFGALNMGEHMLKASPPTPKV